jgi:biotin synthase
MGASYRGPKDSELEPILAMVAEVKALGLETCATLGLLRAGQAERLAAAGLDYYNHNLDTSERFYSKIISTRTYADRLETLARVRAAGIKVCCGGILGMGETLSQRIDFAFELAELGPTEVPINFLMPSGTPLGEVRRISAREALQAIALFRLVLPSAWLRLAGGRELVLGELQAMGLVAGANALIVGNYLTTSGRPAEEDLALLDALGMPVADGPGEGRFIVDGDGAHARLAQAPAQPGRKTIPVNVR